MARLMPGRVRNDGIALYTAGEIELIEGDGPVYRFKAGQFELVYDESDRLTDCPCELFAGKNYCQHLAGVEYYFKQGQAQETSTSPGEEVVKKRQESHLFASRFLDGVSRPTRIGLVYQLSALGEVSPYGQNILWTLKIRRLPDSRTYIIRDIPSFIKLISAQGYYQIGRHYYEQLTLEAFDEASQELVIFLTKLDTADSSVFFQNYGRHLFLPEGFFEEGFYLLNDLSDCQLKLETFQEQPMPLMRPLAADDGLYRFKVKMELDSIELEVIQQAQLHYYNSHYLYKDGVFYALTPNQQRLAQAFLTLPLGPDCRQVLSFDLEDQDRLAQYLLDFADLGVIEAPKSLEIRDFSPHFFLDRDGEKLLLTTQLDYGDVTIDTREDFDALPFSSNLAKKTAIEQELARLDFARLFKAQRPLPSGAALYEFLRNGLAQLRRLGTVTLSPAVEELQRIERPSIQVARSGGLLDISFDLSGLDPADVELALESLNQQEPYFVSRSGQLVLFDDEVKRISQTLKDLRAKSLGAGQFQLSSLASFQMREAVGDYDRASFSAELEEMAAYLASPETFFLPPLPVQADLRDYQKRGVQWLSVLDHYGFGGVLADDMGLGKTLQTIAFLSSRLAAGKTALIVTPSSLIYNWQDEFHKFYPEADVCVVQGNKPYRDKLISEQHQVNLTSYHSFRQDLEAYQSNHYDYLILDEAQALKNSQTKIAQALRDFDVARTFALSGTPIENRLLEIWSIFQIVLPGLFASKSQFSSLSAKRVASIIQPFILRRKKEDVLPELPEVTEISYHNEMTTEQKVIYLAQLERMQERLIGLSSADFSRNKIEILSGITRLRQICNTPQLFMPYQGASGKLESLRDLLLQLKENNRRVLIFSQFKGMLALVEEQLEQLGLESYTITGSTPPKERQDRTRAFNKGSRDAFLMSLKAGGVGLNLTGADTVILIDLWWNPAVEEQAIGRAHRLGQEKAVQVYRLITQGSIEEKILNLQESKRHLIKDVLEGADARSSLSLEDIKSILGIG